MKKMLKIVGCVCIVCAILLFLIAGLGESAAQGTKVSVGYRVNGVYTETNSGYMGRNEQGIEDMGYLKGIAILSGVIGAGALVGSAVVKEEEPPQY